MRHRFQQFGNILVYSDQKSPNKALILKKNPKLNPFVIKSILETNCKRFLKKQKEKTSIYNVKHSIQNTFQQRRQLYLSIQWSKRKAASCFSTLCLNNFGAPGQRQRCISNNSNFFLVLAVQKHTSDTHSATNEKMPYQAPFTSFKAQQIVYRK